MIAEEQNINIGLNKPVLTENKGKYIGCILNSMKLAIAPFLQAYKSVELHNPFNEDELTQIFYSQVQIIIRNLNYPFDIGNQERDLTKQSKGIPDLFFYAHKLGNPPISIFSVECKRLPAPSPKERKKEYVTGNNNNGGIERFKTGKHGIGLNECGMLGFVEKETFQHWQTTINQWITELSEKDSFWKKNETLAEVSNQSDYSVLQSIVYRKSSKNVFLYHLWINMQ